MAPFLKAAIFADRRSLAYLLLTISIAGCTRNDATGYQGYIEAEFVRVAAPFSGTLEKLQVKRGDRITAGVPLFMLEQASEVAARHEAEERLRAEEAKLQNLQYGKRPVELDVVKAQLAQAVVAERLSAAELKRDRKLMADGFISHEKLDTSVTNNHRDQAHVAELSNQLKAARLPGREDEIRAQKAIVDAARAQLAQQAWKLEQKNAFTSKAGLVFDTLYTEGEWVPAGSPVVSLLPPANIKLRFFVPETIVSTLTQGKSVEATCDGCGAPIAATISFISPQPEFTPPVIYSTESRTKLVFLIEAKFEEKDALRLHPGQPIDVRLP